MDRRAIVLFTLGLAVGIMSGAGTASAEERVGVTAAVRNTVSQIEPRPGRISMGDELIRDEVIRTAADSDARFVLRDNTNLSLGPGSSLRLDRTVFADPKAGDIAIKLATGAFRFVTGDSKKEAYVITTPLGNLGIRGTTLDFLIERRRNTVVLRAGEATVCVPGKCVDLIHAGDSTIMTANGNRVNIELQAGSSWTFDNVCNGGLCATTTFAQAGQNIITGSIGTPSGAGGGGTGGPTSPGSFPSGGGGGGGGGGGQTAQGTASSGGGAGAGGGGSGGGGTGAGGFTSPTSAPQGLGQSASPIQ